MIREIEVTNYLSIEYIKLENLDNNAIIGISGSYEDSEGYSNGSGKSSLAETIMFAITGKHRYNTDIEVVRKGTNGCEARVLFIKGKEEFEITRILKVKKNGKATSSTAIVKLNGEIQSSSTSESNEVIEKYFSMSARDFMHSVFFKQKQYDQLLKDKSSARIKFLEEFFEADIFEIARKKSMAIKSNLQNILTNNQNRKATLENDMHDLRSREEIKKSITAANNKNKKTKDSIVAEKEKLKEIKVKVANERVLVTQKEEKNKMVPSVKSKMADKKGKLMLLKQDRDDLQSKIEKAERKIGIFETKLLGISSVKFPVVDENKISDLENKREQLNISIGIFNSKLSDVEEKKEILKVNMCPSCERPIDISFKEDMHGRLVEKENSILKTRARMEDDRNSMDQELTALHKEKKKCEESKKEREIIESEIKLTRTKLTSDGKMLSAFNSQGKSVKAEYLNLKKELTEIEVDIDYSKLKSLESAQEKIEESIEDLDIKDRTSSRNLFRMKDELKNHDKIKEQITSINKTNKKVSVELGDRNILDDLFNKCRTEMLSIGLEELENHANDIIEKIGAVQKSISLLTERENQSGRVKDVLDIFLTDSKGTRPVEGLSGGEWDVVAFSIRTALSRYKMRRMDSNIDFLVLDEVFGSLDEGSKQELIASINMFRNDFAQVFVISHTDLKSVFDYNIAVEMGKDEITRVK